MSQDSGETVVYHSLCGAAYRFRFRLKGKRVLRRLQQANIVFSIADEDGLRECESVIVRTGAMLKSAGTTAHADKYQNDDRDHKRCSGYAALGSSLSSLSVRAWA
jgi:hypothetical protein